MRGFFFAASRLLLQHSIDHLHHHKALSCLGQSCDAFKLLLQLRGRKCIGVTAGASAPDVLVRGMLDRLRELGAASVRELHGEPEDMVFALPKELRLRLVD